MRPFVLVLYTLGIVSLKACGQPAVSPVSPADTLASFSEPVDRGVLDNPEIVEASGLVASQKNVGALWTHNDSGGNPKVYLINDRGSTIATYVLAGATSRDWEDIAIGPGPQEGETYVYVGEIGDNNAQYPIKKIYRFVEPEVSENGVTDTIRQVDTIRVVYPDGARDAETLLVDPWTADVYILSKRERYVNIYRDAFPQRTTALDTLEKLGQIPREQVGILEQLVGGDISSDGKEILLKSYIQVFYWHRNDEQTSIVDLLQTEPQRLPYTPEPQGEASGFADDSSGYYTLSEQQSGIKPHLYFYARTKP